MILATVFGLGQGAAASGHGVSAAGDAPAASWSWPTTTRHVLTPFLAPETPYSAGHRGIDIASVPGEEVRSPADGIVTFVGRVVDRGVLVIAHGDTLRSTLEPVTSSLSVGDSVTRGQVVGTVEATGDHCEQTCVHLGARRGDAYISPMLFLGTEFSVLIPLSDPG